MFNNNTTNFDNKLVSSIQNDYLLSASKYRMAKETYDESNLLNTAYKFVISFVGVAAVVSVVNG